MTLSTPIKYSGRIPEKRGSDRITSDPAILSGKPIIKGTRISIALILEWVASGATRDGILRKHPHLTAEDVEQALAYAAAAVQNEIELTAKVSA